MASPLVLLKKSWAFGGLSLLLIAGPTVADIPDNLTDVVYQDVGWGGDQLRARGYTYIDGSVHSDNRLHEYWWDGRSNTCVHARAEAGKYEMLKVTSPTDCNQYGTQATNSSNKDSNAAAAIAIGAAAILGAAALAHKSHERDDKYNDSRSVAEFDRGYRDGQYHQSYHNYNNTQAYSDGYNAGQQQRHQQTRYRPSDGRYSGYHPYVSLDDLVGGRASSADSAFRERGFRDVGGYKQDNKSYVTWYNASTRQCVSAVTKDGRIKHIDSINEGNCR